MMLRKVIKDIIEFDNYYSWFSAKQLRYNIEIDELGGSSTNTTPTSISGGGGIPPSLFSKANSGTNPALAVPPSQ
uniref:Distal-less n=1 Tax=Ditylenchus dipsaci TaxID=166011 RepID=A0A915DF17_9BILA